MRTCIQRVLNERRGPGFLADVVWFGSSPTPSSPLPSASCFSYSVFLCVPGRPYSRESEGTSGGGAKSYDSEKTRASINLSLLSTCLYTYCQLHKELRSPDIFLYKVTVMVDRKVRQKHMTYPRLSSSGGNVIVVKSNLHICQPLQAHRLVVPVRQADSHRCHQLLCSSLSSTWISCRTNISFLSPSVDFWLLQWKFTV